MKYQTTYESPIGKLQLVSDGLNLIALRFPDCHEEELTKDNNLQVFILTKKLLDSYFKGENVIWNIPIKLEVSDFAKMVYDILGEVEYGKVVTYGDIAKKIAKGRNIMRMSSQAVGNALNKNPLPIIIPCHRVVAANGKIGGFGGGILVKKYLLALENVHFYI